MLLPFQKEADGTLTAYPALQSPQSHPLAREDEIVAASEKSRTPQCPWPGQFQRGTLEGTFPTLQPITL